MENEIKVCDTVLVQKASQGDHGAFAMLVTRYRDKLYRTIFFVLRHEEDTWDLMQDTLLKAYQALPSLKKPEIFCPWLLKIAMNMAFNYLKKKKRSKKFCESLREHLKKSEFMDTPDYIIERRETMNRLRELIDKLPPRQKSVFVLCDLEGHSYKEISEILECRIGTVMSRLYYARDYLRKRLERPQRTAMLNALPDWPQRETDYAVIDRRETAKRKLI